MIFLWNDTIHYTDTDNGHRGKDIKLQGEDTDDDPVSLKERHFYDATMKQSLTGMFQTVDGGLGLQRRVS